MFLNVVIVGVGKELPACKAHTPHYTLHCCLQKFIFFINHVVVTPK